MGLVVVGLISFSDLGLGFGFLHLALLSLFDIVRPLVAKLGVDHDKRAVLHHILIGKDQKAKAKLK